MFERELLDGLDLVQRSALPVTLHHPLQVQTRYNIWGTRNTCKHINLYDHEHALSTSRMDTTLEPEQQNPKMADARVKALCKRVCEV